ncbi:MAG: O-antigen translocase [Mariprofundaceae bacterium]|nr:O-antigen translocase [Mariprofundaceae bacterium]
MTLIKTSLLSLIATIFKISYGLVLNKLLAVYVGPSGVALVGQFQSVQSGVSGIATAGLGQGLTKYLAEYRGDEQKKSSVFATAFKLICWLLLPVAAIIFFFADTFSIQLFQSTEYTPWLKGLAISLIPAAIGALLVASLNGLGEIRNLTMVGVLSSCLGIVLVLVCVPLWGASGVVVGLLLTPVLVVVMAAWYLGKSKLFSWGWLSENVNKVDTKKLGKFTLMAVVSAVVVPLSHILIRNYLNDTLSIEAAGLWTGMWRISEAYLMIITMTLSVYYLPRLASLTQKKKIITEMKKGYIVIMPLVISSSCAMFLLRDNIIEILFTNDFIAMRELFFWQFLGDILKIASFLMGYLLIAKGMAIIFIIKEVSLSVLFVFLVYFFVSDVGLIGVTYAYVGVYLVNFIWLCLIMRKYFKGHEYE